MDYLSVGRIIINELDYKDGRAQQQVLGGSACYGFSALRLLTDSVGIAADVGEDFEEYYGEWADRFLMPRDRLVTVDPHTLHTRISYREEDGSYFERSVYGGEGCLHAEAFNHWAEYMKPCCDGITKGIYCFYDLSYAKEVKEKAGCGLMLEVTQRISPETLPKLEDDLRYADIYSLNRNEARHAFGTETELESIRRLMDYEVPCFFRLGSKGSAMIVDGRSYFVPSVHIRAEEPDPTGCGNSSTAAAMWAYLEGYDPLMTACIANTVSGYNALQYGLIPAYSDAVRADIMKRAESLYFELK